MVTTHTQYPLTEDGSVDVQQWLRSVAQRTAWSDLDVLQTAVTEVGRLDAEAETTLAEDGRQTWSTGRWLVSGVAIAELLLALKMDLSSAVVGLCYRAVQDGRLSAARVAEFGGADVAGLLQAMTKLASADYLSVSTPTLLASESKDQFDNIRKMLVSMIDDVRLPVLKLAERTCAIRAMKDAPTASQQRMALEAMNVFGPLAHRLGIGQLRWELEDYAFRYLEPEQYHRIARLIAERRGQRQTYIESAVEQVRDVLSAVNIEAEVQGRAKHLYGIWRKMQSKRVGFHQIYDVRAVRILVNSRADCYTALGRVHEQWRHIPREFDDYIANPKPNGYRSIHTAVIGPNGKVLEVQIRTNAMHLESELGVCAHWAYKDGSPTSQNNAVAGSNASAPLAEADPHQNKLDWLRQVLEWQGDVLDLELIGDELRAQFADDRIYVYTPEGDVVDLKGGATVLDFGYRVHTNVGHAARAGRVDGSLVSLATQLETGQSVEIITAEECEPQYEWLNPDLGFVTTARAKAKVRAYFRALEDKLERGRTLIHQELAKRSIHVDETDLARELGYDGGDALAVAVAQGDVILFAVLAQALNLEARQQRELFAVGAPASPQRDLPAATKQPPRIAASGTRLAALGGTTRVSGDHKRTTTRTDRPGVVGAGDLPIIFAPCCEPQSGAAIVGQVLPEQSVQVHRDDCAAVDILRARDPHAWLQLDWVTAEPTLRMTLEVVAYDRMGLMLDLMRVLNDRRINLRAVASDTDADLGTARLSLTVDVTDFSTLAGAVSALEAVANVVSVERRKAA